MDDFGVVYTAHDPRLDRHVAIKLLPPDLTRDDTAKQRFLQEAQVASALDHPNICTIHDDNTPSPFNTTRAEYATEVNGTIVVTTDGESPLSIHCSRTPSCGAEIPF
jgi:serine/threonine protein kinase